MLPSQISNDFPKPCVSLPAVLDLSGLSTPYGYPAPSCADEDWRNPPEATAILEKAASAYYGNDRLLVVPGIQAALFRLPGVFPAAAVSVVSPGYDPLRTAWERFGHRVRRLPSLTRALAAMTPLVAVCSPDPVTGEQLTSDALLDAARQLRRRGAYLIVDEVLAEATPADSVAVWAGSDDAPNLMSLRSPGKFFGLAGLRAGFVLGATERLAALRQQMEPHTLSTPVSRVLANALSDRPWQETARRLLAEASSRLAGELAPLGEVGRAPFFCTVKRPQIEALSMHFARRGILIHGPVEGRIRLAPPSSAAGWQRLSETVSAWIASCR